MAKPLMAKATAVWLVDNTTLSFKQIADFVEMHELEIQGIADGDVATGVKGFDPIANNQLTQDEIDAAEKDPLHKLKLKFNAAAVGEEKRRGPRYTPLSKRQDRPAAILWGMKTSSSLRWVPLRDILLWGAAATASAASRLFPAVIAGDFGGHGRKVPETNG